MSNQLGPIEVDCDAPPYSVVRACQPLGVEAPEDVRWCRLSHFPGRPATWRDFLRQAWKRLFGTNHPMEKTCNCGQSLPHMERCTFTFTTGKKTAYFIGQCDRCRTVFWEEI